MTKEKEINKLETAQANELEAAGNNANAKAEIENKYVAKIKALDNEQRAIKRKMQKSFLKRH